VPECMKMEGMQLFDRITWNPNQMNGRPCIRGMRLKVRRVAEAVAIYPNRDDLSSGRRWHSPPRVLRTARRKVTLPDRSAMRLILDQGAPVMLPPFCAVSDMSVCTWVRSG